MKPKKAKILIKGSGNTKLHDIELTKGITPNIVKEKMNLDKRSTFFRQKTKEDLANDADLYAILKPGETIEVTPYAGLGHF